MKEKKSGELFFFYFDEFLLLAFYFRQSPKPNLEISNILRHLYKKNLIFLASFQKNPIF